MTGRHRALIAGDAETLLWEALARELPRARFRNRVPVGPYAAGFLSQAARLIVEIDSGHVDEARDSARTRFLNGQGYRLIRFQRDDVLRDSAACLDAIACALPPECLEDSAAACRLSGPAARAEWSPRPDFPAPRKPAAGSPRPLNHPAGVR